jgi:hypothetical protein
MKKYNYELEETEIYGDDGQTIIDIEKLSSEEIIKILECEENE